MPPLCSPSLLLRRLRFVPSSSPARVFHRTSPSPSSAAARKLLKAKALPSLSLPGLDAGDSKTLHPGQAIGLVAAAQANFMRVIVESAGGAPDTPTLIGSGPRVGKELLCVVRELLKKIGRRILVGDRVLVGSVAWDDRRGVIEDLYRRRSMVIDPPVANVDHLLLLFSMEQPKLEPFVLTRFLVEAESSGIPFTLALNKAELVDNQTLTLWDSRLHDWGYKPMFCSVEYRSSLGILQDMLKGQTTVVVGPSGVGKSSLINCLRSRNTSEENEKLDRTGEQAGNRNRWFVDQEIGSISEKSGCGKHTTQYVSLLPLSGGGFIADTPGFNQPSLLQVTKRTLAETFPEIRRIFRSSKPALCSFGDCLHLGEPGCAVNSEWERYPYYFQLVDEIKIREEFQLRAIGTKREADVRYKVGEMGTKQAEPRLEPKKHRRLSRKCMNQSILDDDDDDVLEEKDIFADARGSILGH